MARTARNEQLSLRDMLLRWCDPTLVEAVQVVEAQFTEDQVKAVCPCSLGGAAPGELNSADLDPDAIARIQPAFAMVWHNLNADLRSRIMISRIELRGIPPQASAGAAPEPVPPSYVNQYDFDFTTNSILWPRGGWRAVTASLCTEAANLDEIGSEPLPLSQAMLTWCDDALVDRYETALMADRLAAEIRAGRLHPDRERRYAGVSIFDIDRVERPWRTRLKQAVKELHADFRARLASGVIELHGLQTEPVLAAERRRLSVAWAERMRFDWKRQSIEIENALFVDVFGVAKMAAAGADVQVVTPPRRRGRPKFPLNDFVAIVRDRGTRRAATNEREADILLAEFRRIHPLAKPPTARTIQVHVDEIYAAAADDAATLKSLK